MSTVPKKKKKTGAQKANEKKQTPYTRNTEAAKRRKSSRDVKTGNEKPKRSPKASGDMDKKDSTGSQRPGRPGAKKTKKPAAKKPAAKKPARKTARKTASAASLAKAGAASSRAGKAAAKKKKNY